MFDWGDWDWGDWVNDWRRRLDYDQAGMVAFWLWLLFLVAVLLLWLLEWLLPAELPHF